MSSRGKDVYVPFIIFYIFIQVPLLSAHFWLLNQNIDRNEGSGQGEIHPKCKYGASWNMGEQLCDDKHDSWLLPLFQKPLLPPKPIRPLFKPRRFPLWAPRSTTERTPSTTTKRTPRTTTTRTPRATTTSKPLTITTRTPLTTTAQTPSTTTTRPTTTQQPCKPTLTKVRGGTACAGQTIFEDSFDSFRDKIWQIEHYIPSNSPDFPFVSYQNLPTDPTVKVENGELRISPKLQEKQPGFKNDTIFTGSINLLQGCTSSADACFKYSWGADILPPIVSGRMTSKGFAFTYGIVTVRAKLPQGDWIYPEILLEPFLQKYGSLHYSSGIINIASARGNRELKSGTTDYSNKVLFGGPVMDAQCYDTLLDKMKMKNGLWGDEFHNYTLLWTPDNIALSVDGKQWAHVEPSQKGLQDQFSRMCSQVPRNLLDLGKKIAPFDEHFYITLGVAAGSINKFPDSVQTENGRAKPWTNTSRKALLNFWQDMAAWYATWNQPELLVDYIKVVAL